MPKPKPMPDAEHHAHVTLFEEWLEEAWIWFKGNWQWPALGLILGVVIVLAYTWRTTATETRLAEGWTQLHNVNNEPEAQKRLVGLRNLVQQSTDPALLAFAYQLMGDVEYQRSFDLSGEARKEALKQAQNSYQTVVDRFLDHPLPLGNSRLGLGLIREDLQQWDQAQQTYKAILDDGRLTGTPMQRFAANRINELAVYKIPFVLGPASTQPGSQPSSLPFQAP